MRPEEPEACLADQAAPCACCGRRGTDSHEAAWMQSAPCTCHLPHWLCGALLGPVCAELCRLVSARQAVHFRACTPWQAKGFCHIRVRSAHNTLAQAATYHHARHACYTNMLVTQTCLLHTSTATDASGVTWLAPFLPTMSIPVHHHVHHRAPKPDVGHALQQPALQQPASFPGRPASQLASAPRSRAAHEHSRNSALPPPSGAAQAPLQLSEL